MDKDFDRCNFRMLLPNIVLRERQTIVYLIIQGKRGAAGDLYFLEGEIRESDGGQQRIDPSAATPPMADCGAARSTITLTFPRHGLLEGGTGFLLKAVLLDVSARQRVEVSYDIRYDGNKTLLGVELFDDPQTAAAFAGDEGDISESDREKLNQLLPVWHERYMQRLAEDYISLLQSPGSAAEHINELEKRIRADRNHPGALLKTEKPEDAEDLTILLKAGVIGPEDLEGFSRRLIEAVKQWG